MERYDWLFEKLFGDLAPIPYPEIGSPRRAMAHDILTIAHYDVIASVSLHPLCWLLSRSAAVIFISL